MAKQLANMLDAVLPGLPPVTTFLSSVQAAQMMPVDEGEADSGKKRLFGDSVAFVGTKIGVAKKSKPGPEALRALRARFQSENRFIGTISVYILP